jgi:hypothetical protein
VAVLHRSGDEAALSFRTRALDAVWTAVPLLLSEGGEVSRLAHLHGWGAVVPPGDAAAVAAAIERLLADGEQARCRAAIARSRPSWTWSRVAEPLLASRSCRGWRARCCAQRSAALALRPGSTLGEHDAFAPPPWWSAGAAATSRPCLRPPSHGGRDLERVSGRLGIGDRGASGWPRPLTSSSWPPGEPLLRLRRQPGAARSDSPTCCCPADTESGQAVDALIGELAGRSCRCGAAARRRDGRLSTAGNYAGCGALHSRSVAAGRNSRRAEQAGGEQPAAQPGWCEDGVGRLAASTTLRAGLVGGRRFCARLRRLGRDTGAPATGFWVVPSARVAHGGGSSLQHLADAAFLAAYHRNLLRYAARHNRPSRFAATRALLSFVRRRAASPAQTLPPGRLGGDRARGVTRR